MGITNAPAIVFIDQTSSVIEDTYLLAGLLTLDPCLKYYPQRDWSGRVSFKVQGKISDTMRKLYEGEPAPLLTYIGHLKALRSAIFALKNTSGPESIRRAA